MVFAQVQNYRYSKTNKVLNYKISRMCTSVAESSLPEGSFFFFLISGVGFIETMFTLKYVIAFVLRWQSNHYYLICASSVTIGIYFYSMLSSKGLVNCSFIAALLL